MSRKDHYEKSDKRFLSDRTGEYGTIAWEVDVTEYYSGDYVPGKVGTNASVRLTDCYQIITLDFCSNKEETRSERVEKVDKLIDSLQQFRTSLIEANDVCEDHNSRLTKADLEAKNKQRSSFLERLEDNDE